MNTLATPLKASIESFFFKGPSPLYTEMTGIFADVKAGDINAVARLTAVLRKRTGLTKLEFAIDPVCGVNAYVEFPQVNINHVLRSGWGGDLAGLPGTNVDYGRYSELIKQTSGSLGRDGSVSGIFSQFPIKIFVGQGLLLADFTPEELAAVVLHEVGHVYGYFQSMGQTMVSSMVVYRTTEELHATEDLAQRTQVITRTVKFLNLQDVNVGELAADSNQETIQNVLIRSVLLKMTSDQGEEKLFSGEAEFIADSYATHSGAAAPLAAALAKIYKSSGHIQMASQRAYLLTESMKAAYLLLSAVVPVLAPLTAVVAGFFIAIGSNGMLYRATPVERLEEVHADLVSLLKNRKLPGDMREALVEDIKFVSGVRETMVERQTLVTLLWLTLSPSRRKLFKQQQFQRDLGRLINNNLYTRASELSLLKGR